MSDALPIMDGVKFFLDGKEVEARPGETIWQVASRHRTEIAQRLLRRFEHLHQGKYPPANR